MDSTIITLVGLLWGLIGFRIGYETCKSETSKPTSTPITDQTLSKLKCVGKEKEGHYSDRWQFDIMETYKSNRWSLYVMCEVDGSRLFIKYLKDMEDLKKVYKAIREVELS